MIHHSLENSGPWNLPVEVVRRDSNHVVGQVHRDGDFIAFTRLGTPHYDLGPEGAVMKTIHGLHLRLSGEHPNQGIAHWGKLLNKALFDECLHGETEWSLSEPSFDRMTLPCPNIMEYLSERSVTEEHLADGSMIIKAWNSKQCEFVLPRIQAKGWIEFTYDWSSKAFEEQRFVLRVALVLNYDAPVSLSTIKQHEERLRAFFDFIWFRGHKTGELYLHDGDRMAIFYRRSSLGPEVRAASGMELQSILDKDKLADWIQRWFALSDDVRMAIEPVVTIARNPGIITDMKLVMTLHALDALLKATKKPKGKASESRFLHGLGLWWKMKRDLSSEALSDYIKRIVSTRNVVLKAARHERKADTPLLKVTERTKAYYEMLLLHRALFLEMLGVEKDRMDSFIDRGFGRINATQFRYFKD